MTGRLIQLDVSSLWCYWLQILSWAYK